MCGSAKKERKEGCIMKKFSLLVAVILFVAPALAKVEVDYMWLPVLDVNDLENLNWIPGNEVVVKYRVTEDEPSKVRAFALDITLSNGNILSVDDSINPDYTIYPGSISIVDGEVNDLGTAVADPCDLPGDTKGGIGTNAITIEMGALYAPTDDNSPNAPPAKSDTWYDLFSFTFGGGTVSGPMHQGMYTKIDIEENVSRGGIVMTDGEPSEICLAHNQALCWGCTRQCYGDAECRTQKVGKVNYWVSNDDLLVLASGYVTASVADPDGNDPGLDGSDADSDPDTWMCANFDNYKTLVGKLRYHVTNNDLLILAANYLADPLPADCVDQDDCQPLID